MDSKKKIAFTGQNDQHTGKGGPKKLCYPNTILNSKAWNGDTFVVPKSGLYHFSLVYLRDQQVPQDGSDQGTCTDTRLDLMVNSKLVAYAWAGESSGRQTGTVSVTLDLEFGDEVTTQDWEVDGEFRRYRNCVFTGFAL